MTRRLGASARTPSTASADRRRTDRIDFKALLATGGCQDRRRFDFGSLQRGQSLEAVDAELARGVIRRLREHTHYQFLARVPELVSILHDLRDRIERAPNMFDVVGNLKPRRGAGHL